MQRERERAKFGITKKCSVSFIDLIRMSVGCVAHGAAMDAVSIEYILHNFSTLSATFSFFSLFSLLLFFIYKMFFTSTECFSYCDVLFILK